MQELSVHEVEQVSGGMPMMYGPGLIFIGLLAGIAGAGLTVAGLGTPISIAGAALAVEGATAVGVGLVTM